MSPTTPGVSRMKVNPSSKYSQHCFGSENSFRGVGLPLGKSRSACNPANLLSILYVCCCLLFSISVSDSATPWTAACQASLSITNSRRPPKPMSIESVMPSSHLILCRPLLLLPSVFPSIRVFPSESALHIRGPKDWTFSFSIRPSSIYSGLIAFRIDWSDLFAVQGTLKSLLQHHSSKASVLWCSAFLFNIAEPRTNFASLCFSVTTASSRPMSSVRSLWRRLLRWWFSRANSQLRMKIPTLRQSEPTHTQPQCFSAVRT